MSGLAHFLRGFTLMLRPGIRPWVLIPLLINTIIFVCLTVIAWQYFDHFMVRMTDWLPHWLGFVAWILSALFAIFLGIIYGYTFAIATNIISAPFYGILAQQTQFLLQGKLDNQALSWQLIRRIAWHALLRELQKLWYFLPRTIAVLLLCLALALVPIVNILAPLVAFLWGSWSLSVQFLDYAAEIDQVAFKQMRATLHRKRRLCLVFGGLVLLGTSIPVVNMLVLPAAVVGATSLWFAEFAVLNGPAQ